MSNPRLPVAIALIAAVVAGVVWGPGLVVRLAIVRSHPYALDRFYRQDVDWHACRAESDDLGTRCAEVTVPLDYDRPPGRTTTVSVARRLATDTKHRVGTLLLDTGSSLDGMSEVVDRAPTVAARHDLVAVDPRLSGRGLVVQDLDVLRSALLEERVSYLGWSSGGALGEAYARTYPRHVRRVVSDGAGRIAGDPPTLRVTGNYLFDGNRCVAQFVQQYLVENQLPPRDAVCPR
ncbi:alpha/beta fold hydrolase [Cryptosporangium phraense]|uniref:Alpha/beta hydrolase n=1 Tax=Cryptosporangium phraense TaxID=2593070 RepID=A0A545AW91_9ACTN|nr:alpha/beta hydrolase [Cryptosporangium phraense]TQS45594.1 alpha/beta hydrolase [Cryptosporangium phraense]